MIRAVLDANVVVSAIISPSGIPGRILRKFLFERAFVSVQSELPLLEISGVLLRPGVRKYLQGDPADVRAVFEGFRSGSTLVSPVPVQPVSRDPDDDIYLATAMAGAAGYIVTGDRDLLVLDPYGPVRIVTAREFLDLLDRQPLP